MFMLSPNEALRIQYAQIAYYRQSVGRSGIKAIRKATTLPNSHPDKPIKIHVINEHIPRGGDFERYIKNLRGYDETRLAWHNAIQRGLF